MADETDVARSAVCALAVASGSGASPDPAGIETRYLRRAGVDRRDSISHERNPCTWASPLPGLSRFPELNVRTYVTYRGKPGVYFFSLDAANWPAVWAARRFFQLPYFAAAMSSHEQDGVIHYASKRDGNSADFRGIYQPAGPVRQSLKNSLEHFLTERYCLYTVHNRQVYRCDIHHLQWPLQDAQARLETNTMAAGAGIQLPDSMPLLHFARQLEVLIWPLRHAEE